MVMLYLTCGREKLVRFNIVTLPSINSWVEIEQIGKITLITGVRVCVIFSAYFHGVDIVTIHMIRIISSK